jgi:tryptophan synthase alpha subunit
VIQSASTRALDHGTTLDGVLGMLRGVSDRLTAPVLMFTYYNPIMARGADVFCAQARDAGASGGVDCTHHMHTHRTQGRDASLHDCSHGCRSFSRLAAV